MLTRKEQFRELFQGLWGYSKMTSSCQGESSNFTLNLKLYQLQLSLITVGVIALDLAILKTEFVPDEGWQSLEVAYHAYFGKGFLTWEWKYGLRSYIYPILVAFPIPILDYFNLISPALMLLSSRLFQGVLLCFGLNSYFNYSTRKYGFRTGVFTLINLLTLWFLNFVGIRTLSNSFELAIGMIALNYLSTGALFKFVSLVSLAFVVRPTTLIYWTAFLFEIYELVFRTRRNFIISALIGLIVLGLNFFVDYHFYGRAVIPWWNFFMFNFIEGKSSEFGTHSVLWYLYCGIPSIMGFNVILVYIVFLLWPGRYVGELRVLVVFTGIYSLVAHKEIRFLLPIVPHLCTICGDIWGYIIDMSSNNYKSTRWLVYTAAACTLSANIAASLFFMNWHQAGILPATRQVLSESQFISNPKIWVLMPCFSFPIHTYLHHENGSYEYFICGPKGYEEEGPNWQSDSFRDLNLNNFVTEKLKGETIDAPDFILLYDYSTPIVLNSLRSVSNLNYKICGSYYHTAFPFDSVGENVQVLCRLHPIPKYALN